LGILTLGEDGRVVRFTEKPKLEDLSGLESCRDPQKPYLASMGIYIFSIDILLDALAGKGDDFGKDIIPPSVSSKRVMGYVFDGYWEDIGTIQRFYEVNLEMTHPNAPFEFHSVDHPIYTHPRFLPNSEVYGAEMHNVLLSEGCRVMDAKITRSVVGLRSLIASRVVLDSTILMGADFYETDEDQKRDRQGGRPYMGIGAGSVIERAIIDKNARIGQNVRIRALPDRPDEEHDNWVSREGIVIVLKNGVLPNDTVI
jgi:glucose-1-phosphate adenylyltransferase